MSNNVSVNHEDMDSKKQQRPSDDGPLEDCSLNHVPHITREAFKVKRIKDVSLQPKLSETRILTDAFAKRILSMPDWEGERALSADFAEKILRNVLAGTFVEGAVIISVCFIKSLGLWMRANGQHTCHVKLQLPDWKPKVTYQEWEVDTFEDFKVIYGGYDVGRRRSDAHVLSGLIAGIPEIRALSSNVRSKILGGFKLWRYGAADDNTRRRRTALSTEQCEEFKKYVNQAIRVGRILSDRMSPDKRAFLSRAAVVGAMLETAKAETYLKFIDFWTKVRDGVNLEETDPAYILRNYLTSVRIRKGESNDAKRNVSSGDVFRHCVLAWEMCLAGSKRKSFSKPRLTAAAGKKK